MKRKVISFALFVCVVNANSQIAKKDWMFGGSVSFSSVKTSYNSSNTISNDFQLNGNAGYFIIDKLAIGLLQELNIVSFEDISGSRIRSSYFSLGPYARYYLLPKDKHTNIFVESSYSRGSTKIHGSKGYGYGIFSFGAGPEIFITRSVGVQFTVGYSMRNSRGIYLADTKAFKSGLGIQVHL